MHNTRACFILLCLCGRSQHVIVFIMPKGNRVGSKVAVVKRTKSKKRSGFLGTPKWRKDEERRRPKSTSEITIVPDCDVGSDSDCSEKPLPVKSSSKRKTNYIESSSSEEYEFKEAKRAEGYRLWTWAV